MAHGDGLQLPIEWHVPAGLQCQYATNMVVQSTEHEFILSFYQVSPPLLLGSAEEVEEKLAQMGAIRAECVARLIVAPGRMGEFVEVLRRNWESHVNRAQAEGE
jgi:hypothetical protein